MREPARLGPWTKASRLPRFSLLPTAALSLLLHLEPRLRFSLESIRSSPSNSARNGRFGLPSLIGPRNPIPANGFPAVAAGTCVRFADPGDLRQMYCDLLR